MENKQTATPTQAAIYERLKTVIDPELNLDIVSLGLIYDVTVKKIQAKDGEKNFVHILMTLTTPGCPLIDVLERMIKDSIDGLDGINGHRDVEIELTFDPPWIPDMMDEASRAELGL